MFREVTVPSPGESITQVILSKWLVEDHQYIDKNTDIAEIDSDKATLVISSDVSGIIHIEVREGETANVGATIARIEATEMQPTSPTPTTSESKVSATVQSEKISEQPTLEDTKSKFTPLAKKIIEVEHFNASEVEDFVLGKKIDAHQVLAYSKKALVPETNTRETQKTKMSPLRLKLSERLVSVKNETAMLTTFNEVNMSAVLEIKAKYNEAFKAKNGFGFGLMSFFTKAATIALQQFPQVNSQIEGEDILQFNYCDISIAVSTPKGLVVPVVRNTEQKNIAEIEQEIKRLAAKARENKLSIDEMSGGTFTITNGGVFGSLMATPIINPPQSAILGMHNIVDRPIALNGQVVIRPMMYIALSYDHRIIDGRESVGFLKMVKELIENPISLLFNSEDPIKKLLDI